MRIDLVGKKLITAPIKDRIVQGENNADVFVIVLPKNYNGNDLSLFSFRMRAVSKENDTVAEQMLPLAVTEDGVELSWAVTSDFTAVDGEIYLELIGVGADEETTIKFTGAPINVITDVNGTYEPPADVLSQALLEMQNYLAKAQEAVELAEDAAKGESAYKIAVDNGFVGSEEEWLASLKGEKGEKGEKGDKGDTGESGTNLKILGKYITADELFTAIPDGSGLDGGYIVGTDYYYWADGIWNNAGSLVGPQGEKGDKGDTGEKGDVGEKGDKGETGETGDTGEKGDKGDVGEKGDKGDKGDDGLTVSVNGVSHTDGNIPLTLDDIPDGIERVLGATSGVNMTVTTLYSGSYNGNTFTESTKNYDIVVVCGTGIYYDNKNYGWILSSPIMFFPKLNLTYYTASFSLVNYESSNAAGIFDKGTTPYYRLNDKSLSIGSSSSNPSHGTITVYGIKLGG